MAMTEAHIKASNKYTKANCKKMTFEFNKKTDEDILIQLEKVPSKLGYIKKLIREDIARSKGENL